MKQTAIQFGQSLDKDEFHTTKELLSKDCTYHIGEETLIGPTAICNSYEENMIAGRKKLDVLEWGESSIEDLSETEFYVHFTDYLTHNNVSYTHRYKQKLTINSEGKIAQIEHIDDPEESSRLNEYYVSVGIKTN